MLPELEDPAKDKEDVPKGVPDNFPRKEEKIIVQTERAEGSGKTR